MLLSLCLSGFWVELFPSLSTGREPKRLSASRNTLLNEQWVETLEEAGVDRS